MRRRSKATPGCSNRAKKAIDHPALAGEFCRSGTSPEFIAASGGETTTARSGDSAGSVSFFSRTSASHPLSGDSVFAVLTDRSAGGSRTMPILGNASMTRDFRAGSRGEIIGRDRQAEGHGNQRRRCRQITRSRTSLAENSQGHGEHDGDRRPLPKEMNQRHADSIDYRIEKQALQVHDSCLSMFPSSLRICVNSSGETFFAEKACIISFSADPSQTRSSRSATNCRCVFSAGTRGL